jgi:catechol 2,3-dioxygenase-like lactoylglutathione lyase family enzyme
MLPLWLPTVKGPSNSAIAVRIGSHDTQGMNCSIAFVTAALLVVLSPSTASAQLLAVKEGPIVYGHHHLNVTSVEEHKKFWVDTLGGTATKAGTFDVIKIPNVLIFLSARARSGPTKGSSLDHIGFSVPNLRQFVDKVKASGYQMVTATEVPAGVSVTDDIAARGPGIAYVMAPDGVKVELLQSNGQKAAIMHHHIHLFGEQSSEMRAWYMKVFGAIERPNQTSGIISAELPGGVLNFSQSPGPVVPTRGRALDHIGFEVRNLAEFCKKLEAQGIKIDVPFRDVPALKITLAFITDPWGTYIELNEGLANELFQ